MKNVDVYQEFAGLMALEERAQALAALRQDALIWLSLQQPGFFEQAVRYAGKDCSRWSPGRLALVALKAEQSAETLLASPLVEVDPAMVEPMMQVYQNARAAQSSGPQSLEEAGLLALALRERRRVTGSWNFLSAETQQRCSARGETPSGWRAALACLYGMIPEPDALLRALMPPSGGKQCYEWLVHTLLCQPGTLEDHLEVLGPLMKTQTLENQVGVARSLSLHGQEELAGKLAGLLVADHPAFASLRMHTGITQMNLSTVAARAFMLQQLAALHQISGNRVQAASLLQSAEGMLKHWTAGLYLQEINLGGVPASLKNGAGEARLELVMSQARRLEGELGAAVSGQALPEGILQKIPDNFSDPVMQIRQAVQLSLQGEPQIAGEMAAGAAKELVERVSKTGLPFWGEFVYEWEPQPLIKSLVGLGLAREGLNLAQALIEARPVDVELLNEASLICEQLGEGAGARQYAQAAAALQPEVPDWRRRLGQLWMAGGEWQRAQDEFEAVLALSPQAAITDQLALGQAALRSGALERVVEVCEGILKELPDHGGAAGLLGQALAAQGDLERALTCLSRATLYAPTEGANWLALAKIQRDRKETQRALETLRSAVLAIPPDGKEAADANLALGEICLECGLVPEALPALRQAYTICPSSTQAAYLYGKTLLETGKAAEAAVVLESTRAAWEGNRSMAYTYAAAARELRDLDGMINALEAALRPSSKSAWETEPAGEFGWEQADAPAAHPIDWHLLYVRALLGDLPELLNETITLSLARDVRLYRAEHSVRRILAQEPAHYEARFYKAQLFMEQGEPEQALQIFRSLVEVQGVPEHALYGRVQWGVGRAALRLGQLDTALAALKEACQTIPGSLHLQRDLAEACVRVDLPQEALVAAQHALQLAPDQVENLVWYAGFVSELGERRAALDALECAIQLEPARHDLRTGLADWYVQSGNLNAARGHLEAVRKFIQVDSPSLRRAASLYLLLDDTQAALECLERAVQAEEHPSLTLLYDLARLLDIQGRDEEALAVAQQALAEPSPSLLNESISLYLLQSDLLSRSGRLQAALASLEKVLRVTEEQMRTSEEAPGQLRDQLGEIHERFSKLLVEMGNLPEAFYHIEKALDIHPERTGLRYRAASLALATLQLERAARITEEVETDHLGIAALKAEIALEMESVARSSAATGQEEPEKTLPQTPAGARLLAVKARQLARRGEWQPARRVFDEALELAKGGDGVEQPVDLWLAEAALETQNWNTALAIFEAYAIQNPHEPRAHFALARALVVCAEQRRLCQSLDCRGHAPTPSALSDAARAQFEASVQTAFKLANNQGPGWLLIRRWQVRGQAVMQPTVQTARDLASLPQSAEDTAALVAVLGLLGRRSAMNQAAQRYIEEPSVRIQLALNMMDGPDLLEGIEMARKLAADQPQSPLAHALHARMAALSGREEEALQAYEQALALWPGESGWHDSAGDLAYLLDKTQAGMDHREQALRVEPYQVNFALKLGEACLASDAAPRAVEVLEEASIIASDRADIWLALSLAYRQAGKMQEALDAALQVGQVESASGQGFLLAADICVATGQLPRALEYARSAVMRAPEDAPALLMLSKVLEMQGLTAEAVQVLEEAPPVVRNVFDVAFERARLIYRLKGPQFALAVLDQLILEYPDEPDLLSFLAFAQYESGSLRLAERNGLKSLKINPNQPELTLMLGRLQHKAGQLDQAVYLLCDAVRMSPEHLEALLELGAVYQERRESPQALQVYGQAMRVAPSDYRAYYQSGLILRDSKDYAGAEAMLRRAVDLAQDNAGIRRQLLAVIALNLVHNKQEVGAPS